jgi:hypothetical protein
MYKRSSVIKNIIPSKLFLFGLLFAFATVSITLFLNLGRQNNLAFNKNSEYSRYENTFTIAKSKSLNPSSETLKRTAKLQPPFVIKIQNINDLPIAIHTPFTLETKIHTAQSVQSLHYKWILPAGVTLISPTKTEGIIYNLNSKAESVLLENFVSNSENNEKIFFQVWSNDGGSTKEKLIASIQFNTLTEPQIQKEKFELASRQTEYLADHPELLKTQK